MKTIRLTKESDELYADFKSLCESAFPAYERRTDKQQSKALADSRFHLDVSADKNEKFMAFFAYWDFGAYIFIEHFAVAPELRGGGIGSQILKGFFAAIDKPCILEIDPPEDEISIRRLHFYERLGFLRTPFYISPIYGRNEGGESLLLLSRPKVISNEEFEKFHSDYRSTV